MQYYHLCVWRSLKMPLKCPVRIWQSPPRRPPPPFFFFSFWSEVKKAWLIYCVFNIDLNGRRWDASAPSKLHMKLHFWSPATWHKLFVNANNTVCCPYLLQTVLLGVWGNACVNWANLKFWVRKVNLTTKFTASGGNLHIFQHRINFRSGNTPTQMNPLPPLNCVGYLHLPTHVWGGLCDVQGCTGLKMTPAFLEGIYKLSLG